MRIRNHDAHPWNRAVAPFGNMGRIDPMIVAELCDRFLIPWFSYGEPISSGISAYCTDDDLWERILEEAKY